MLENELLASSTLRVFTPCQSGDGGIVTYQVVQLNGVDTLVDTRDDLLRDSSSIDVIRVEAITKPRHTGSDLVELHAFFASVYEKTALAFVLTSVARPATMQDSNQTRLPRG
jgi:hypothetical protein